MRKHGFMCAVRAYGDQNAPVSHRHPRKNHPVPVTRGFSAFAVGGVGVMGCIRNEVQRLSANGCPVGPVMGRPGFR